MATTDRSREEAKQETRAALIAAGLAAFADEGLDTPSLDSICSRAGFTRGAFYVHFESRDDFLVAVMESVLGDFLDAVISEDADGDDLEQTLGRFKNALVHGNPMTGEPGSMRTHHLLDVCSRAPQIRERFLAMVEEARSRVAVAAADGQRAGTVRNDIPPQQIASLLVTLAMGVVQMFELGTPLEPEKLHKAVLLLLSPNTNASGRRR